MSYISATRIVQNVIDYVKRQFGDESGVQINDTDVIRWINAGQDEIFRRSEPIKATSTTNATAGQYAYNFPADVLKVQSILYDGTPVRYVSFQEAEEYLLSEDPKRTQTGIPQIWFEWGGEFTLWPTPPATIVNGITIKYVKAPTAVTAVGDTLSTPDTYFNRLVEFVLQQAYELDENWAAAESKANQFGDNLQQQTGSGNTSAATYPRITVLDEDL